jgi:hypothetical protein
MSDINAVASAFAPEGGPNASTIAVTAGLTASTALLPQVAGVGNYGSQATGQPTSQFEIYNAGSVVVYVAFGTITATAVATIPTGTAGSYPIPPGCDKILTVPGSPNYIGVISSAAGQVIYVTPGSGV